jgi:phytol kinase
MLVNPLARDLVAMAITFAAALAWLRLIDALAQRGRLEARLSRKIIHVGTGPLFVLCWLLFSPGPAARWLAALVPLAITGQFLLVGLGVIEDPAAVQAMTRTGDRREILRGPLLYGIIFVVCTLVFWRTSPVGIVALMLLCGGDGLADIVGRRLGRRKLPFNPRKSWAGSLAFALGGFAFALAFVALFGALGVISPPVRLGRLAAITAAVALATTAVEAATTGAYDNLTTTGTALLLGILLY